MRWLRGMNHRNESDALNEFWDEVVQRSPATPLTRDPVPTELGAIVRQLHAEQDTQLTRPIYADRQLAALLSLHREADTMNALPLHHSGIRPAALASMAERAFGDHRRRDWMPALSAGAAIAILLAFMLALAIFANLFGDRNNHPVILAPSTPTSQASPSPEATASLVWSYTGEGENKLANSTTGTIAPDGTYWVVDAANGRIQILNPDGSFKEKFGIAGNRDGQFMFDMGPGYAGEVAVNPDGSFYVAEAGNQRIQKFTQNRKFLASWSGAGTPIQTFGLLIGVSIDPDGNVWAADESGNQISKFTPDGRFLLAIDGIDTNQHPEPFTDLGTLGFNPDGQLLVADGRGEIQVFDLDGKYLKAIPLVDAKGDPIHAGYDVSADSSGRMYVPDPESKSVYVYDANGQLLLTWTGPGPETSLDPWSVVADSDGNMYIVDVSASVVYKVHIDF